MLKKMIKLLAPALLVFGMAQAAEAPAFTLKDTTGKEHSLADFKGKTVVLEWFNHGCPFVKKHYDKGHMQALQKTYTEKGVIWLAICSSASGQQGNDTAEGHAATAKEKGTSATAILMDEDGTVGKAYAAKTTPHMFVINGEGKIVYQGAIDDKRSANTADIEGARNYVREALDALAEGKEIAVATTTPYGCSVKYAK
jgi:peroxiredoxin